MFTIKSISNTNAQKFDPTDTILSEVGAVPLIHFHHPFFQAVKVLESQYAESVDNKFANMLWTKLSTRCHLEKLIYRRHVVVNRDKSAEKNM